MHYQIKSSNEENEEVLNASNFPFSNQEPSKVQIQKVKLIKKKARVDTGTGGTVQIHMRKQQKQQQKLGRGQQFQMQLKSSNEKDKNNIPFIKQSMKTTTTLGPDMAWFSVANRASIASGQVSKNQVTRNQITEKLRERRSMLHRLQESRTFEPLNVISGHNSQSHAMLRLQKKENKNATIGQSIENIDIISHEEEQLVDLHLPCPKTPILSQRQKKTMAMPSKIHDKNSPYPKKQPEVYMHTSMTLKHGSIGKKNKLLNSVLQAKGIKLTASNDTNARRNHERVSTPNQNKEALIAFLHNILGTAPATIDTKSKDPSLMTQQALAPLELTRNAAGIRQVPITKHLYKGINETNMLKRKRQLNQGSSAMTQIVPVSLALNRQRLVSQRASEDNQNSTTAYINQRNQITINQDLTMVVGLDGITQTHKPVASIKTIEFLNKRKTSLSPSLQRANEAQIDRQIKVWAANNQALSTQRKITEGGELQEKRAESLPMRDTALESRDSDSNIRDQELEQRFQQECDNLLVSISSNMQPAGEPVCREIEDNVKNNNSNLVQTLYASQQLSNISEIKQVNRTTNSYEDEAKKTFTSQWVQQCPKATIDDMLEANGNSHQFNTLTINETFGSKQSVGSLAPLQGFNASSQQRNSLLVKGLPFNERGYSTSQSMTAGAAIPQGVGTKQQNHARFGSNPYQIKSKAFNASNSHVNGVFQNQKRHNEQAATAAAFMSQSMTTNQHNNSSAMNSPIQRMIEKQMGSAVGGRVVTTKSDQLLDFYRQHHKLLHQQHQFQLQNAMNLSLQQEQQSSSRQRPT